MRYLIDTHHRPPNVVLISPEEPDATGHTPDIDRVAQLYANMNGRSLVLAVGPAPDAPDYKPIIAGILDPVVPPVPQDVSVLPVLPSPVPAAVLPPTLSALLAPAAGSSLSSFWASIRDVLVSLEPAALSALEQLLLKLITK